MQWDDENRLQKVTEANSITRFKYDDQGQRKVKFHHKPNSGTGKETIYINQFYNVSNRAISTKHIFAGTSRMVSKLKGGSILLRESSDLTDDHYTGANDKPRNPGQGKAVGKTNGKGKKLGHDKGKGKKQNGKTPKNGKGAKQFQDGNHPGQVLEHRPDRANEVAQNVYKNPNLQYLLDDPNSPYYQGGTPGQSDPDAPIQNEDGTIHDAQIIVIGPTDDQLYFFHPDHLGSTSYVTDEDGDIHEHVEYFPFGETWYQEGGNNKVTPYLFTSKELDSETGYYYFGARYYDPRVSTWISPDPILGDYLPNMDKEIRKFDKLVKENSTGQFQLASRTKESEMISSFMYWNPEEFIPGLGGVFNSSNLALYSFNYNNPVKFKDPDGNISVPFMNKKIEEAIIERAPKYGVIMDKKIAPRLAKLIRKEVTVSEARELQSLESQMDNLPAKRVDKDGTRILSKTNYAKYKKLLQKQKTIEKNVLKRVLNKAPEFKKGVSMEGDQ